MAQTRPVLREASRLDLIYTVGTSLKNPNLQLRREEENNIADPPPYKEHDDPPSYEDFMMTKIKNLPYVGGPSPTAPQTS